MQLPRCRPAIVSALQRCITRGSAIQITVLAFPFKVPNPAKVGARKLPDFAELAAIHQCLKLRTAIQRIYPPGLEYHILHDGPLMANVFDVEMDEVRAYEAYFSKLVEMLAPDCVCCHDFGELQLRSLLDPSGSIEELRFNAERWFQENRGTAEWTTAFRKTLGMINLRELPVEPVADLLRHATIGRLPSEWEHIEHRVYTAMVRYHVADAIIHQFDPRPSCFPRRNSRHNPGSEMPARPLDGASRTKHAAVARSWMPRRERTRAGYPCRPGPRRLSPNENTPFVHSKGNKRADIGIEFVQ